MPRGAKSRRPRGNSKHCHDGICGTFQFSAHPAIVSMSGEKVKPQSPFKTLANILQGFLFPALRVSQMFGGGPSGRNRSKSCFVLWSRRKKVSKLKSGSRIRPDPLIFPQPPIISRHFRFRIFSNVNGERERMFYAVSVAGRGQRMENIGKSFVKVLTFLGKYVFWGIIKIK